MKVAIAGGHGQIALITSRLLRDAGHEVTGLIRNHSQQQDVRDAGAVPAVVDLEDATADQLAGVIAGSDAVVFAAGAGPGSTAERKHTVDRDAAILLAEAARLASIARMIVVSSINADRGDPKSSDIFQIYLVAKAAADAAIRETSLDWTIIRPGTLTNEAPTGLVHIGADLRHGAIPRADVAVAIVACLAAPNTIGKTFEMVSGREPLAAAIAKV